MDVNSIGQESYVNMSYSIDNVLNNNKETKQIENIKSTNDDYTKKNTKEYDKKDLDKSLKKLNKFLEDEAVHAEYSVHKDLNTIMIKIVNDNTKEVIMEIPPQKILDMVASMCKQVGLIDEKA